jgi:hypothetical protein
MKFESASGSVLVVCPLNFKGILLIFIMLLFPAFSLPAFGLETRNLLFETNTICMEGSFGESPSFQGLIQNVNKFENPIEFVDRKKNPVYDSIGVVTSGNTYGTAFLFASPCYILTAFHVAFGEKCYQRYELRKKIDMSKETLGKERVVFSVGATNDSKKFRDQVSATPLVWGNFLSSQRREDDWALLRLDKCLENYQPLPVPNSNPEGIAAALKAGVKPAVLGYYSSISPTQLYGAFKCKQFSKLADEDLIRTDCSVSEGVSGGPVVLVKDGTPYVVGIMSGEGIGIERVLSDKEFGLDTSNQVVPMFHIIPEIEKYFAAHPPAKPMKP